MILPLSSNMRISTKNMVDVDCISLAIPHLKWALFDLQMQLFCSIKMSSIISLQHNSDVPKFYPPAGMNKVTFILLAPSPITKHRSMLPPSELWSICGKVSQQRSLDSKVLMFTEASLHTAPFFLFHNDKLNARGIHWSPEQFWDQIPALLLNSVWI